MFFKATGCEKNMNAEGGRRALIPQTAGHNTGSIMSNRFFYNVILANRDP
jgi:hypothetical protein